MQMQTKVPDELYRKLGHYAIDNHMSRKQAVITAIEKLLAESEKEKEKANVPAN